MKTVGIIGGLGMEARNTVTGMLAFFGSAIVGALNYSAEAVENFVRDPAGSARAGLESIKAAGAIVAPRMLNALQNPLKTIAISSAILGNAVLRAGSMCWDALTKDPASTVAKTLIVAGGVVAAFPTGGISLMVAGGVISAIGAGALLAKDAYEYATAKNDADLERAVKENQGDSLWILGGR